MDDGRCAINLFLSSIIHHLSSVSGTIPNNHHYQPTMPIPPEEFIPFAEQLATISGEVIRRYYRKDIAIEDKQDATPVTLADMEVEKAVRAVIRNSYPDHGIIGEELEPVNPDAEYKWLLDPIDGTKSFMIGRPIFGTLISLIHDNEPILGIIDQPILGERWTGVKGFATNFNYEPVRVRKCARLSEAVMCTTSPNLFKGDTYERFDTVRKIAKYVVYGGDCYSYGLLARGSVDVVLETDLKPHDFCALAPIITGAHGTITDWQGNPVNLFSDGNILACSDRRLHKEVLALLNV